MPLGIQFVKQWSHTVKPRSHRLSKEKKKTKDKRQVDRGLECEIVFLPIDVAFFPFVQTISYGAKTCCCANFELNTRNTNVFFSSL